jgi:hypothetical protein
VPDEPQRVPEPSCLQGGVRGDLGDDDRVHVSDGDLVPPTAEATAVISPGQGCGPVGASSTAVSERACAADSGVLRPTMTSLVVTVDQAGHDGVRGRQGADDGADDDLAGLAALDLDPAPACRGCRWSRRP